MACNKLKFPGKDVVLEYVIGCPEELPTEQDWKRFGSLRTKEFEISWDTTDATDADSVGSLRENLATFQTMTISGDGTVKASGTGAANLIELTKHVINPSATGGQPAIWLRMTFPDLTFTAYMLVSTLSRSAPYDDVTTYSFEASASASDFGLIVEDTPDADADDVTSISAFPETIALAVNGTAQAVAAIAPTTAPQGVQWLSSDPAIATVTQSGVVTGLTVGEATITARASADAMKTDTITVTVA
ncbi:phage tail protein [Stutzerimonas nitrititolerans]|uniref:phage tail protein n=1 Tax=Stutzerimonas nitrititolerans TaxID=2482751 RepID=UPI0028B257CE|nr:phage tail protein [Stutzerimonas nitrititolerans]